MRNHIWQPAIRGGTSIVVVLLSLVYCGMRTAASAAVPPPTIDIDPTVVPLDDTLHPQLTSYVPGCGACTVPGFGVLAAVAPDGSANSILEPIYNSSAAWRTTMALANTTTIFGDFPVQITPSQWSVWDANTVDDYRQVFALEGRLSLVAAGTFSAPAAVGTPTMTTHPAPTATNPLPAGYRKGVCATQPLSAYSARGNGLKAQAPAQSTDAGVPGLEGPEPVKDMFLWQLPGQQCR